MTSPTPSLPAAIRETTGQEQHDLGKTENDQPQEPEPVIQPPSREFMILWGSSSYRDTRSVVEVVRRTKTQVVIRDGGNERRFRESNGREVGGYAWAMTRLAVPRANEVAEVREEMHRRALIARIKPTEWHKLSTAQLEAVAGSVVLAVDRSRSSPANAVAQPPIGTPPEDTTRDE